MEKKRKGTKRSNIKRKKKRKNTKERKEVQLERQYLRLSTQRNATQKSLRDSESEFRVIDIIGSKTMSRSQRVGEERKIKNRAKQEIKKEGLKKWKANMEKKKIIKMV